jgi:hypothetical protein
MTVVLLNKDVGRLLLEIELSSASGHDIVFEFRWAGVSNPSYFNRRKKIGEMGKSQLSELKD